MAKKLQEKKMRKCSICKAQLKEKNITYTQELEGKVYVVSDVPALVCVQCGEQYLSPDTVDMIQKVIEQGEKGKRRPVKQIPVFNFPQM